MRTILVTRQDKHLEFCRSIGIDSDDLITYDHPVKAIDNLTEIKPDTVVISAHDFPRHWKPLLVLLRELRKDAHFFLIIDAPLHITEKRKADTMAIDGYLCTKPLSDYPSDLSIKLIESLIIKPAEHRTNSNNKAEPSQYESFPALVRFPDHGVLFPAKILKYNNNNIKLCFLVDIPQALTKTTVEKLWISFEYKEKTFSESAYIVGGNWDSPLNIILKSLMVQS